MQFSYSTKGTKRLFKTYNHQQNSIKEAIEQQTMRKIENNFSRIKPALRTKYNGHDIFECRVNLNHIPDIRIAFWCEQESVKVVYATTTLTKAEFTRELEKFLG